VDLYNEIYHIPLYKWEDERKVALVLPVLVKDVYGVFNEWKKMLFLGLSFFTPLRKSGARGYFKIDFRS